MVSVCFCCNNVFAGIMEESKVHKSKFLHSLVPTKNAFFLQISNYLTISHTKWWIKIKMSFI